MQLNINRALRLDEFARRYAEDGIVQIPDVFDADTASHIEQVLRTLPWHLVCQDDTRKNILLSPDSIRAMSEQQRKALEGGIRRRAAENFGYVYLTYPMIQAMLTGWNPGHPIHAVTQFLNSPTFVSLAREVTGCADILKTDAQASNFGPGHFLTRHVDDGLRRERKAAYTIGFTRKWEPDWGGLLAFIDEKMDVSRALIPRFNMLTVFDGLRVHSVSAVADFAPAPRLSIVGWFRDDPPPGGVRA
jgi:Rps23 Pro-64 3,4-dihydroxylase Tpa1-like proline 4-hydroxylase